MMIAAIVVHIVIAYAMVGGVFYSRARFAGWVDWKDLAGWLWPLAIPIIAGIWAAKEFDKFLARRKASRLPKATAREID